MDRKYEFTGETKTEFGVTLHRIRALRAFGNVKANELGGWVEAEINLSQDGNAWVSGNARVSGNAQVCGDALVYGNARVYGDAQVSGNARVYGDAWVYGDARVYCDAWIYKQKHVFTKRNIGSRNDTTTFFRNMSREIFVVCGCFRGNIAEFESAVKKTHGNNQHAQDYAKAIEMAKIWIDLDGEGFETEE